MCRAHVCCYKKICFFFHPHLCPLIPIFPHELPSTHLKNPKCFTTNTTKCVCVCKNVPKN